MDTDVASEASDKRLNRLVAITVVILSVFMAVCKIKDDNLVQAMQKAQSLAVDTWTEYQSTRVKLHVDENGLNTLRLLESTGTVDKALAARQVAEYEADIAKYQKRSAETMAKARAHEAEYETIGYRDDQFDMSEAFLSIAIAVAATAALAESYMLIIVSWISSAFGVAFGFAGFLGWSFHPEWLVKLLT